MLRPEVALTKRRTEQVHADLGKDSSDLVMKGCAAKAARKPCECLRTAACKRSLTPAQAAPKVLAWSSQDKVRTANAPPIPGVHDPASASSVAGSRLASHARSASGSVGAGLV